ncbi:protein FAR1-RELATED SEQUENCE 6-like isoform X2 [Prosopis cineraria]|uniref:protein FAR1-RELATED SEQUENCE 6-like isoform X2 n=1 Tax=Prosopis cineraria TaxID=364024 RepID=UPI00240EE929|nr:protein FAR1-RELATED SEQUENCE 6-like isoform X2 [Prosopis cineraria]XP_054802543.1 protein FAR1-RELATED SEQUENCE 6-like isoform X2 [Prosopis cineraria]XP_054802544.1 protein FAR1-RELATED SEQUENCE 6-like isoform X2 [Prosopis cineraria]
MANHADSLIPLDINANECEVDVAYHSPKERGPEIRDSDENDVVPTPQNGMIFGSEDEVKSYYTKYANQVGFGVMTRTSRKGADGKVGYFILACSREGFRRNMRRNPIRSVPSRKQKCEARINVSLCKDGFYRIQTVTLNHNHELSPGQVNLNVHIDMRAKRKLDPEDQTEAQMNKSFRSSAVGNGVYDNVALSPNDCGNYIRTGGRLIGVDGDGNALYKYFMRMQEQDCNFFYVIDLDDYLCVRNVFWADARSRAAYKSFGDVVTLDTTYLSDQYKLPLACFVGVNHHGQSILFGCGLMSCRDTKSFVWLFQSWLHCMCGVSPKGVISDECKALQNAIKIVFPFARHRWCLSHIMKKFPEKLGQRADYKLISCRLKNAIYNSLTPNEFEMTWKTTVKEFGLEDSEWLNELYLERHRWVPTFVKSEFWAGMSTIRFGEIMHPFFDGFVGCQSTLKQFLDVYDNALQTRAEREFEADFRSFCITLACATKSPFERQFQTAYTHAKFLEVQREFVGKADCNMVVVHDEGSVCRYNVIEDVIVEGKAKEASFGVIFDRVNYDVKCGCHMFEFKGILCRHSLAVLSQERVKEIPCKYVLDRWRTNLKRRHAYVRTSYNVKQLKPRMERFDLLSKQFDSVAEVAAEFEETSAFVSNTLCDLKEKLEAWASHMRNSSEAAAPISCAINGAS